MNNRPFTDSMDYSIYRIASIFNAFFIVRQCLIDISNTPSNRLPICLLKVILGRDVGAFHFTNLLTSFLFWIAANAECMIGRFTVILQLILTISLLIILNWLGKFHLHSISFIELLLIHWQYFDYIQCAWYLIVHA